MTKSTTKTANSEGAAQTTARVTVYPRAEVLDPQGKAIEAALGRLGFDQVAEVRAGKSFEITLQGVVSSEATEVLEQMCRKLLVNEVVEDFVVEIAEQGVGAGS